MFPTPTLFFNPLEKDPAKNFWPGKYMDVYSKILSVSDNVLEIEESAVSIFLREHSGAIVIPEVQKVEGFWQKLRFTLSHKKQTYTVEKVGGLYKRE